VGSWRKAWNGTAPVEPFQDTEWVGKRREFLAGRSAPSAVSDEVAAREYCAIQAQWIIDHVDVLQGAGTISRANKEIPPLTTEASGRLPQVLLQLIALPSPRFRIRSYGYGGGAGEGGRKVVVLF
jgi:hypothetical protein